MDTPKNFTDIINLFISLISLLVPVVMGLAVLVFFKGLVQFIAKAGDEKSHSDGKSLMIWGLVALFVMFSVSAIIRFLFNQFGFVGFGLPLLPQ